MKKTFLLSLCSVAALVAVQSVHAQIALGDLVIYRVGDGSAALGTTATSVFLDEYNISGGLVQSIALPNAGGAGGLTAVGNAATEGIISRSLDGSTLLFTGYQKAAGGTSPAADTYATTARVVGTLTAAGAVNTSTTITSDGGATTANTIRSATSVSGTAGSAIWTSTSSRVSYDGSGLGSLAATTTQIDARNSRQVNMSSGPGGSTLIGANGSTALTAKVQSYGVLPVGATVPTPLVSLTTADAVNGFVLFDENASVAGDDTLYALSTVGSKLLKYSFDGTSWIAEGSISTTAQNLCGYFDGVNANLYLTGTTTLYSEVDSSGYLAPISGSLTTLATAGANTGFRGIGMFNPVPEPSSFALLGIGLLGLRALRRKR